MDTKNDSLTPVQGNAEEQRKEEDFAQQEGDILMSVKRGIDISAHNGDINLAALKSQIDFVIIRVGFGTSGTIDKKFKRNADLCKTLGIPFGFY